MKLLFFSGTWDKGTRTWRWKERNSNSLSDCTTSTGIIHSKVSGLHWPLNTKRHKKNVWTILSEIIELFEKK